MYKYGDALKRTRKKFVYHGASKNVSLIIFGLFIASLFFDYQPGINFGTNSGINLKLSLTIVFAVLFCLMSLKAIFNARRMLSKHIGVRLFVIFALINTVSIFWSINKPRGIFETGLIWLLFALFIAITLRFQEIYANRKTLLTIFYVITVFVCLFAWWQMIGDAFGLSQTYTLLPTAYQSALFGFARPTGFSLEPEFLASLLVIPIALSAKSLMTSKKDLLPKIVLLLSFSTIVTTISRGGIIAATISLLIVLMTSQKRLKRFLQVAAILFLSLILALTLIGVSAGINTHDSITTRSAITGTIRQLTLGKIDLQHILITNNSTVPTTETSTISRPAKVVVVPVYVAESTDSRLQMSDEAIKIWTANPRHFVFGIGIGAFGATIHQVNNSYVIGSIVNNEYLQVASELGIIGLIVFLSLLIFPIVMLARLKKWYAVAILIALYSQWWFFSGNINVIHLWVWLALSYGLVAYKQKASAE